MPDQREEGMALMHDPEATSNAYNEKFGSHEVADHIYAYLLYNGLLIDAMSKAIARGTPIGPQDVPSYVKELPEGTVR